MTAIPDPIIVFYKSMTCKYCTELSNMWDSVTTAMKSINPKIRFYVLTAKDNTGKFDVNVAPKDLHRFGRWFPMILLVPGPIWDAAMANLGPTNPVQIKDGVQAINGMWEGSDIKYYNKYDIRKVDEISRWFRDALEHPDFKRVQNDPTLLNTLARPAPAISPLISNIIRPAPVPVPSASPVSPPSVESPKVVTSFPGDVCQMRIIPRRFR